jgi:N-carbamoylputrescine amidase
MHIPDDPLYYEKFYFTPGDLGYRVFKTRYADIGVIICWDQWFPEAARLTAMKGAQVIFIPTAIGNYPGEADPYGFSTSNAWEIVQRGHAVANAVFIAPVNRVGLEPNPAGEGGIDFYGSSFIADPSGALIAKAPCDEEQIMVETIDLAQIENVRKYLAHFFRDRRIDSYQGLLERFLEGSD